jgi:hypothetical protein
LSRNSGTKPGICISCGEKQAETKHTAGGQGKAGGVDYSRLGEFAASQEGERKVDAKRSKEKRRMVKLIELENGFRRYLLLS